MTRLPVYLIVTGALCAAPALAGQHEHAGHPPERLGTVHFNTSCSKAVEAEFDRATALLHSFWWNAAIDAYSGVLAKDPSCAMANWGIAVAYWGNPFTAIRLPDQLQKGRAAIEKAQAASAGTERERDYIGAVAELYRGFETRDNRTRALDYEKAMERVAAKYPDDTEAQIFYALALDQTALPTDKTYANQLKAAAILEPLFAKQPDHPGLAHYIIHTYDTPALADRALGAATRYASIAPSAPHALHMPSHTFTRVGYWQQSIETNIKSAEAAEGTVRSRKCCTRWTTRPTPTCNFAQDKAARKVLDGLPATAAKLDLNAVGAAAPGYAGLYALAAMPARYAVERAAWSGGRHVGAQGDGVRYNEAMTYFARALGRARSGQAASARADIAKLVELRDALTAAKNAYWAEQVEIQRRAADAWVQWTDGRKEEAINQLRSAADMEDATDKTAMTPGPLKPARELLGELLLEAAQPAAALTEFEKTTKKEPNRFRGVYGAARAADLAGDRAKAKKYLRATAGDLPRRRAAASSRAGRGSQDARSNRVNRGILFVARQP